MQGSNQDAISGNLVWGGDERPESGPRTTSAGPTSVRNSTTPRKGAALTSITPVTLTRRRSSQVSQFRTAVQQEEREYYVPLRNFVNVMASESRTRFGVIRLATYILYVATWIIVMMLDDSNDFGFECKDKNQCESRKRPVYNAMNQHLRNHLFYEPFNPEEPSAGIDDIDTPDDLNLWVDNVLIPGIWGDVDGRDVTKSRVMPIDPVLIKFTVREERQQCADLQGLSLKPGPCRGPFIQTAIGPPEDPNRYAPSKDEMGGYPGLYAMLAWRDEFFDRADKTVLEDGSTVYTVPDYDTTITSFYSLSGVRIFNVSTEEQARDFFANAREDGVWGHLSLFITLWTSFYTRNADFATVVRSVFMNSPGGGTRICWDSWNCADYGTLLWARNLNLYSFDYLADYAKVFFEVVFFAFTSVQIVKEVLQLRRAKYTQGSTRMYFLGSGGFWNILDVWCGIIIIIIYSFKILLWMESAVDPQEDAKFWAPTLPILYYAFHKSWSAILVLFLIFRLFKYLEFSNSLGMVGDTFAKAAKDLFFFTFIFVCIIVAYAYAAYFYFGNALEDYITIPRSVQSVFKLVLGQVEVDVFSRTAADISLGTFTTTYYWSVIVLVYFIMINMFLAIIVAAFDAIREDLHRFRLERLQGNKYVPPKITVLEWMSPLPQILMDRVKGKATWRSITYQRDSMCKGWRQSHLFPEQCCLALLENRGIIHRRRPPMIEHIVAYDAGRQEFLVKWACTREEWATEPLLKQAEPKWLSRDETQDLLDNPQLHPSHLRMSEILPGGVSTSDSLLSWESRFIITLRALRRSAREDIKRLTGLPDIYTDTYWTRGMANLVTYSVNTSISTLLPRRIIASTEELQRASESETGSHELATYLCENFPHAELSRMAMNANKLTREELTDLLTEHFSLCGGNWQSTVELETNRIIDRYGTNRNIAEFSSSNGELALLRTFGQDYIEEVEEQLVEISLKTVMQELRSLKELQRLALESIALSQSMHKPMDMPAPMVGSGLGKEGPAVNSEGASNGCDSDAPSPHAGDPQPSSLALKPRPEDLPNPSDSPIVPPPRPYRTQSQPQDIRPRPPLPGRPNAPVAFGSFSFMAPGAIQRPRSDGYWHPAGDTDGSLTLRENYWV